MTDIEIVREAIEIFAVQYFDTIEMSGTVQAKRQEDINYLSIDLTNIKWDENLDKLHQSLLKYLQDWGRKNFSNFQDYVSISRLTIEYLLPEKDGANQNQSRHVKLFFLPSYYYKSTQQNKGRTYFKLLLRLIIFWHNLLLRNTILILIPTVFLIVLSIYKIKTDNEFHERLAISYDYINVASGIIASFVLGFLINKVINIRQDKLRYTRAVRNLSNKLSYFRNICFKLAREHNFWTKDKIFFESYEYVYVPVEKCTRFPVEKCTT